MAEPLPRLSGEQYLKTIEALAKAVCDEAAKEGWLQFLPDASAASPMHRAVNEMARSLRYRHGPEDGCE